MKISPAILAALACGSCLLFVRSGGAQAPSGAGPNVILFVGNSFTHGQSKLVREYNATAVKDENEGLPKGDPRAANRSQTGTYVGIPGIFKKMTDEAGLAYEVHVETVGGKNLEFHYKHALPLIAQARWNTVVLQDLSTGPLPESRNAKASGGSRGEEEAAGEEKGQAGSPDATRKPSLAMAGSFYQHVPLLEKAVHVANPAAKVYLYATWPTALLVYPAGSMYSGEKIDVMGTELHDAYYRAAAEDGHIAGVAPVGDAWLRAIHEGVAQENPYQPSEAGKLDLWGEDHKHPSSSGAYLAALVLFERITGRDARTLGQNEQAAADLKISPENAARLQQVAYEQVTASPVAAIESEANKF